MSDVTASASDGVARELYPLALKQARGQVLLELAAIAAVLLFWTALGFPRNMIWTAGWMIGGGVATAYDVRWWLWLRRAEPAEAFARLQARDGAEGGTWRIVLTTVAGFALWTAGWFLGK